MKRLGMLFPLLAVLAAVSACGEKPQTLGGHKGHVAAYQGAQNQFVEPGWTPTDKKSWEQGLKARMQNSQNEYPKMNTSDK